MFVGKYSHYRLNINVHNLNEALTNNIATSSHAFHNKLLELHRFFLNLEKLRELGRKKISKPKNYPQANTLIKQDDN